VVTHGMALTTVSSWDQSYRQSIRRRRHVWRHGGIGVEHDRLVEEELGVIGEGHVLAKGTKMTTAPLWMVDSKPMRTTAAAHSTDQ
jgi:hypothetical protein